jgi:hypothetical protein
MNAYTVNDLEATEVEAADLLALARLDDDGAPCPGGSADLNPPVAAIAPPGSRQVQAAPAVDARPDRRRLARILAR